MNEVRWCCRSHAASSSKYHSSPSGIPILNRQCSCNGSKAGAGSRVFGPGLARRAAVGSFRGT
jgi:hypothetical protein